MTEAKQPAAADRESSKELVQWQLKLSAHQIVSQYYESAEQLNGRGDAVVGHARRELNKFLSAYRDKALVSKQRTWWGLTDPASQEVECWFQQARTRVEFMNSAERHPVEDRGKVTEGNGLGDIFGQNRLLKEDFCTVEMPTMFGVPTGVNLSPSPVENGVPEADVWSWKSAGRCPCGVRRVTKSQDFVMVHPVWAEGIIWRTIPLR
jgi:hypothetical protein